MGQSNTLFPEHVRRAAGLITIDIPGIPKPGGSKTATVIRRKGGETVFKNGRPMVTTRDACKGNAEWKQQVAFFARQQYDGDPLKSALSVHFVFTMPRIKGHYRTGARAGELKSNAPTYHTVKPDTTKLIRSTEDALKGILWIDDAQIAEQSARKIYGDRPGAQVTVTLLEDEVYDDVESNAFGEIQS